MEKKTVSGLSDYLEELKKITNADFSAIALEEASSRTRKKNIYWHHAFGHTSERYKKIILQVGKGLAGVVWRTGRPLIETQLSKKNTTELLEYPIALMEHLENVLATPVLNEGKVIAVLLIGYRSDQPITEDLVQQTKLIATQIAILFKAKE